MGSRRRKKPPDLTNFSLQPIPCLPHHPPSDLLHPHVHRMPQTVDLGQRFELIRGSWRNLTRSRDGMVVDWLGMTNNLACGYIYTSLYCSSAWPTPGGRRYRAACLRSKVWTAPSLHLALGRRTHALRYGPGAMSGSIFYGACQVWFLLSIIFWVTLLMGLVAVLCLTVHGFLCATIPCGGRSTWLIWISLLCAVVPLYAAHRLALSCIHPCLCWSASALFPLAQSSSSHANPAITQTDPPPSPPALIEPTGPTHNPPSASRMNTFSEALMFGTSNLSSRMFAFFTSLLVRGYTAYVVSLCWLIPVLICYLRPTHYRNLVSSVMKPWAIDAALGIVFILLWILPSILLSLCFVALYAQNYVIAYSRWHLNFFQTARDEVKGLYPLAYDDLSTEAFLILSLLLAFPNLVALCIQCVWLLGLLQMTWKATQYLLARLICAVFKINLRPEYHAKGKVLQPRMMQTHTLELPGTKLYMLLVVQHFSSQCWLNVIVEWIFECFQLAQDVSVDWYYQCTFARKWLCTCCDWHTIQPLLWTLLLGQVFFLKLVLVHIKCTVIVVRCTCDFTNSFDQHIRVLGPCYKALDQHLRMLGQDFVRFIIVITMIPWNGMSYFYEVRPDENPSMECAGC